MDRLLVVSVPFFAPILIGYFAGRVTRKPEDGLAWLNFFVIYVALPPVFYQVISKTPFAQLTSGLFIFSTVLASYTAFATAFAVAYVVREGNLKEATLAGGIGGYGNVGYMGPGLAVAVLGPAAVAPMALVFCFDVILFFTLIPLLVALSEEKTDLKETFRLIVRRVAFNPFILATFIGVMGAYFEIRLPNALDRTLDFLRAAAAPAALFALGVTVALRPAGHLPLESIAGLAIKLIGHPILVYVILSLVGVFDPIWVYTAVLMAALPPALSVFVLATQYETYVERSSTAVLVGTLASIPTLLIWLYLIDHKTIPAHLFPS